MGSVFFIILKWTSSYDTVVPFSMAKQFVPVAWAFLGPDWNPTKIQIETICPIDTGIGTGQEIIMRNKDGDTIA